MTRNCNTSSRDHFLRAYVFAPTDFSNKVVTWPFSSSILLLFSITGLSSGLDGAGLFKSTFAILVTLDIGVERRHFDKVGDFEPCTHINKEPEMLAQIGIP